ncbi:hypothetical protein, partial [Escherichia coli]|uniref:hypothetical protein n=1 Tax=Escherichia coli TaxID=562 RepID=UPI001965A047
NYTEWRQHMQRWLMQYRSVCRYDFKARRVDYGMHPRWEVTYRFDKKEIAALFKLSWSGVDTAVAFV